MREKKLQLVITFHTTADAMAMEELCKKHNIEGRLIPVPREISAGCGLSWKSDLDKREALVEMMALEHLENQDIHEVMLY